MSELSDYQKKRVLSLYASDAIIAVDKIAKQVCADAKTVRNFIREQLGGVSVIPKRGRGNCREAKCPINARWKPTRKIS